MVILNDKSQGNKNAMKNFNQTKKHILSCALPALVFGIFSGAVSATVVTAYKWFAKNSVAISEKAYHFLSNNYIYIPVAIAILFFASIIFARIYRKAPNLQGGGIPTSIGAMRGYFSLAYKRSRRILSFVNILSSWHSAGHRRAIGSNWYCGR